MKISNIIFSAVHLFITFLMMSCGCLFLWIPYSKNTQYSAVHLILNESHLMMKIGLSLIALGFVLFGMLYFLNRKRYFQIKMKYSKALVDEAIIKEYITDYWKEAFPKLKPKLDVMIHPNQKIEVVTSSFPDVDEEIKEDVFNRVQAELSVLLSRRIGYEKDFTLTICEK